MAGSEKTIVLRETFQGSGRARYDRYHLLLYRNEAVGFIQERAGSPRYEIFQLANSIVRLELSNGGPGRPPVLEITKDGGLVFRAILGGRRPRPIKIGEFRFVPCVWGATTPQEVWGPSTKVEEVSPSEGDEGEGSTLPI
jgi:hypothetical protein